MRGIPRRLLTTVVLLAAVLTVGCSTAGGMTPQQQEGVELRRYCERNPMDRAKCNGFLGFL
jgi:hypothetical protein